MHVFLILHLWSTRALLSYALTSSSDTFQCFLYMSSVYPYFLLASGILRNTCITYTLFSMCQTEFVSHLCEQYTVNYFHIVY